MSFTGISPQTSVFGTEQSQGILVAKCVDADAPGGFVFSVVSGGSPNFYFVWVSTDGELRIIPCTIGVGVAAVYDPGTNQMTFTAFDADTSGTVVGTQT